MLTNYTMTVFYGANNTPLFGYDNKQMEPDAQKAYESALKEAASGSSPLLDDLKAFMDAAAKDNFKFTKSLEQFRSELAPLSYE
ncbi:hypothetical protein D3C76_1730290 [compost metagenome]